MNGVDVKTTTTTQMKIKKATVSDEGKFVVDGEEINLIDVLKTFFEGCIFDLSVTEKTEVPVEE